MKSDNTRAEEGSCKQFTSSANIYMNKTCTKCNEEKDLEDFHKDTSKKDGRRFWCKSCSKSVTKNWCKFNPERHSIRSRMWEKENPEKVNSRIKIYRAKNPGKFRAKDSKKRAARLLRVPSWSNLELIKKFYEACPYGYQVDHIIPLQGKNVSGLHVLENLQYLTKKENYSKGNRYPWQKETP